MKTNLGDIPAVKIIEKIEEQCAKCMKRGGKWNDLEWGQFSAGLNRQLRTIAESNTEDSFDAKMVMSYWNIMSMMLRSKGVGQLKRLKAEADKIKEIVESGNFRNIPEGRLREARTEFERNRIPPRFLGKQRDVFGQREKRDGGSSELHPDAVLPKTKRSK